MTITEAKAWTAASASPASPTSRRRRTLPGKLLRFAVVGSVSTGAYLLLYAAFATTLSPQAANALALLLSAIGNTAANRRFTYGVRGRDDVGRQHVAGLAVFVVGLAFTAGALALLHALTDPDRAAELTALICANLVVTAVRFVALRRIFARGPAASTTDCNPAMPPASERLRDEDIR